MFSRAELSKVLEKTLPEDRTNAIVGTIDKDGAAVVLKMRLKEQWEIEAVYRREWGGNFNAEAKVIYSW